MYVCRCDGRPKVFREKWSFDSCKRILFAPKSFAGKTSSFASPLTYLPFFFNFEKIKHYIHITHIYIHTRMYEHWFKIEGTKEDVIAHIFERVYIDLYISKMIGFPYFNQN